MVHKNLPRVTCEICQKEVSRVSLKAHINRHREKQEEEEESARHLLSLSMTADSNAPSCRVCTKYFESEKLLEMHACEGRDGGSSFPCQHCNESFTSATELVGHSCDGLDNSKSRNTAKIYKCIFCNREYGCHTVIELLSSAVQSIFFFFMNFIGNYSLGCITCGTTRTTNLILARNAINPFV